MIGVGHTAESVKLSSVRAVLVLSSRSDESSCGPSRDTQASGDSSRYIVLRSKVRVSTHIPPPLGLEYVGAEGVGSTAIVAGLGATPMSSPT
jgi:hypothetical protein